MYGSDWFQYDLGARLGRLPVTQSRSGPYTFESWLLDLEPPSRTQLETHRARFGPDCVEIPKETRSVSELQAAGLSVREIAHTLGIKEREVALRLRVGT